MVQRNKVEIHQKNSGIPKIKPLLILHVQQMHRTWPFVALLQRWSKRIGLIAGALALAGCAQEINEPERLIIIGQDLGAYQGYVDANVSPEPDGITQYLNFFELSDPDRAYGSLGLDLDGQPYNEFVDAGVGQANARLAAEISDGPVLAIGLSMAEHENPNAGEGALARVAAGDYDAQIDRLIDFARVVDKRILLRIAYEFEGVWNIGYHRSDDYRAAYRRVATRIQASGVKNVEFVWQASASPIDDILDQGRDPIEAWYPGDDVVDWVGVSMFLPPDEMPSVEGAYTPASPRELLDEMLDFARAHDKPVIVAEAAPQGYQIDQLDNAHITTIWDGPSGEGRVVVGADGVWDGWFVPFFDYLNENRDVIEAVAYINADWDSQERWGPPYNEGYWGDTRIEANAQIAENWHAAIAQWRDGSAAQ